MFVLRKISGVIVIGSGRRRRVSKSEKRFVHKLLLNYFAPLQFVVGILRDWEPTGQQTFPGRATLMRSLVKKYVL